MDHPCECCSVTSENDAKAEKNGKKTVYLMLKLIGWDWVPRRSLCNPHSQEKWQQWFHGVDFSVIASCEEGSKSVLVKK